MPRTDEGLPVFMDVGAKDGELARVGERLQAFTPSMGVDLGVTKLMNISSSAALIFSVDSKLLALTTSAITLLSPIDRNTAECIHAAVLQQVLDGGASKDFDRRVRIAVTDGHGANHRNERAINTIRESWDCLHLPCEVHILAGVHKKVWASVDEHVSGMLAVSLSLSAGGQMSLFRKAFRQILEARLEFVSGELDEATIGYRDFVLNTFLPGPYNQAARLAIARCAGGDWRAQGKFHVKASGMHK